MTRYRIGVDSTDSAEIGMCTTYLGAILLERLMELPMELSTYPELIRLNPNVPWKTRGNGAVCLRYEGEPGLGDRIKECCFRTIDEMAVMEDPQTNPGFAMIEGDVPKILNDLYQNALQRILTLDEALNAADISKAFVKGWKNGMGIIGALASIGADLREFTYEAIMYRSGNKKDRERTVNHSELQQISRKYPSTFFNIDEKGDPICIPHSPCPVILGIRGTDPGDTREALLELELPEAERWVLWRTNQHTDAHIKEISAGKEIIPFSSISMDAVVSSNPEYGGGGHLHFMAEGPDHTMITAWAYEPTRGFRKELSKLVPGDVIRIWGSVREPSGEFGAGVNLEKVEIKGLKELVEYRNPRCSSCGGPTESMGKGQGLRCKICGSRGGLEKGSYKVERNIETGMIQPPLSAWRHLFRPVELIPATAIRISRPFFGTNTQS